MSWIREEISKDLPNFARAMSINPTAMQAVNQLGDAVSFGASTLTRVQEEAIATTVSVINKCRYWTLAHGALLRQHSGDSGLASALMHDYRQAELDPQTRGLLDFSAKLTGEPWSMQESDVQRLRELGLEDDQILSGVLITCLYNFATRVAQGLGVEFPHKDREAIEKWLAGPARDQEWLTAPVLGPQGSVVPEEG